MDWDLSSYFSTFGSPAYEAFKDDLLEQLEQLEQRAAGLNGDQAAEAADWVACVLDYEKALAELSHLSSYVSCLVSANAENEAYQKEENRLSEFQAVHGRLQAKLIHGLGQLRKPDFSDLLRSERLEGLDYVIGEWRRDAGKRMDPGLEDLAADLEVNGVAAWSRLYFTTMGNLEFTYADPESGPTTVPMSQYNSLLSNPNRERRIAAAEGAARTLKNNQQLFAGALNAISGTRHTLNRHRGIEHFLIPTLRTSRISRPTLRALIDAVEDRVDFAREVFRFRSSAMGIEDPGYCDLRAPLPLAGDGPGWNEGIRLISKAFNRSYPALGGFFDEIVGKNWIDHTPRRGKRPGGFCTSSLATRESRIFMTYKDTLNDILTLAHEAGHAWHSRLLKETRSLAASYPMTLAETASTFAEKMFAEGLVRDGDTDDTVKLVVLDSELEHMLAFLLDLPVRFRFEEAVYERRASGTLSPGELCELMTATQRKLFGETLSEGREDPWFWASKMHFYINKVQFYNYPYTFGYLLSTAYMKRFREEEEAGLAAYEKMLKASGGESCESIVRLTLGEDIEDPNFWGRMIDELGKTFSAYKSLYARHAT